MPSLPGSDSLQDPWLTPNIDKFLDCYKGSILRCNIVQQVSKQHISRETFSSKTNIRNYLSTPKLAISHIKSFSRSNCIILFFCNFQDACHCHLELHKNINLFVKIKIRNELGTSKLVLLDTFHAQIALSQFFPISKKAATVILNYTKTTPYL